MTDGELTSQRQIAIRSAAIWVMLICAEIIHGILREILLVPPVGKFRSNQIGVFTGSAIIILIASFTIRWIGAKRTTELLTVGFLWLVLTVTFEILFGRFVMEMTWEQVFAGYNLVQGGLMPLGLLLLFFSPMIAARLHSRR